MFNLLFTNPTFYNLILKELLKFLQLIFFLLFEIGLRIKEIEIPK